MRSRQIPSIHLLHFICYLLSPHALLKADTALAAQTVSHSLSPSSKRLDITHSTHHRVRWPDPAGDTPDQTCSKSYGTQYFERRRAAKFSICSPTQHPSGASVITSSIQCFPDDNQPTQTACFSSNIVFAKAPEHDSRRNCKSKRNLLGASEGSIIGSCANESMNGTQRYITERTLNPWGHHSLQVGLHHLQACYLTQAVAIHATRMPAC